MARNYGPNKDVTFYFSKGLATVAVTGVSLDKTTAQTIDVDGTVSFTATVAPDNATDKTVKWSVGGTDTGAVKLYSDEACTTEVGADAIETLTVYAKGESAGSATVTATSNADSTKSASCDVTVNAAQTPTEGLITTITATGKEQASYNPENVASVSFSYTTNGSSAYFNNGKTNWGWWGYGWTATVTPAEGYTITKCVFYDDKDRTATDSEAPFVVETTEEDKVPQVNGTPILAYTSKGIKKIEVYGYAKPAHAHNFSYSADGATITATCTADGCTLPPSSEGGTDHVATLTIAKPEHATYGDGKSAEATITDENGIKGTASVAYYKATKSGDAYTKTDVAINGAPTEAGDYVAEITLGTEGNTATASVGYTIAKATLADVSVAQSGTLTYTGTAQTPTVNASATAKGGQAVTFTYSKTQDGTFGDMPTVTDVADSGTFYYKASAPNHEDATGSFAVTVGKADQEAPAAPTEASASANSITLKTITNGEYKMGDGDTWQESPTFTGLTKNTEYSFYQRLKEDANHNASPASTPVAISTTDHAHEWTYQANGATITATCANTDGGHGTPLDATLTIAAPANLTYDASAKEATVTGSIDGVETPAVAYKKGAQTLDSAPTDAGTYTASITLGEATANVEYTIAKADPTATAPTGLTATYGQKLSDVTLPTGWAWKDATQSVGNVVTPAATFKAKFTPQDTANYNVLSGVDVAVTVNKAANPATVAPAATVRSGSNSVDLSKNVTLNGATGEVSYAISGDKHECELEGSVLTSGFTTETVTVNVTVTVAQDANHDALEPKTIAVQVVSVPVTGLAVEPAEATLEVGEKLQLKFKYTPEDATDLSLDWDDYDHSVVDVDGAGIVSALRDGTVTLTARATNGTPDKSDDATAAFTVTVVKPAAVVTKAPTAKALTYDGSAQELVGAGQARNGTMQYALGKDAETAPTSGWAASVPTATEAGTYHVWYRAAGDADHRDSEPACVEATIAAKPEPSYAATAGAGSTWSKASKDGLSLTFKRAAAGEEKDETFSHFRSASVDGKELARGKDYTAVEGSVVITLAPAYLDTLPTGKHTLTAAFDDGSATAEFTVADAPAPEPDKRDYPAPAMSNSKGGDMASTSDEITYTVSQKVPEWASSVRTWVDVEPVLQLTSDAASVAVTCDGRAVEGAKVTIDGQRVTVEVADATALRGRTLQFSYRAKVKAGADLSAYLNQARNVASVPYQAHTAFDGDESAAVASARESVKFKVSSAGQSSSASAPRASALPKTGDAAPLAGALAMALAGAGAVLAGGRRRR